MSPPDAARARPLVDLVLFDRDGTLVHDVPYNGDPDLVRRYGLKVPVLLLDGSVICHYTLNSNELLRILKL